MPRFGAVPAEAGRRVKGPVRETGVSRPAAVADPERCRSRLFCLTSVFIGDEERPSESSDMMCCSAGAGDSGANEPSAICPS